MKRIADAEPRELDTWHITMSAGEPPSLALVHLLLVLKFTACCCFVTCDCNKLLNVQLLQKW